MTTYCYKTKSGKCEGQSSPESFTNCDGKFTKNKPMSESSTTEKCKLCNCELIKDFQEQSAPGVQFIGTGFHKTDY